MTTLTTNATPPQYPGRIVCYKWVDEGRVPRQQRRLVRRHVDECARELGLPHVAIRWFVEADDQTVLFDHTGEDPIPDGPHNSVRNVRTPEGSDADFWCRAKDMDLMGVGVMPTDHVMTIGIHAGLRGQHVAEVVAHECRHLIHHRDKMARGSREIVAGWGSLDWEDDADAYAASFMSRLSA